MSRGGAASGFILAASAMTALSLIDAAGPAHARETEPDWLRKPSSDDLDAAFPVGLEGAGKATLHCRVNISGLLENCQVVSESPAGKGVGPAALLLVPSFLMRPATKDGKPVTGEVNIPVTFHSPGRVGPHRIQGLLHPLWLQAPTMAQMAAAYPPHAPPSGHVSMRCKVSAEGALRECVVLTETPRGRRFGAAAKSLAPDFRVYSDRTKGDRADVRVVLPVTFAADPPSPRYLTAPEWRLKPTADKVIAVYPPRAIADGIMTGHGTADCEVRPDGALADCRAVEQTPANEGFGEAAATLAGFMAVAAWTQDGLPIDGARVRIPFRFNYAHADGAKMH